jgi:hypothetical protein
MLFHQERIELPMEDAEPMKSSRRMKTSIIAIACVLFPLNILAQSLPVPVPNENSVWRAGGFSVRTVTRRAARVCAENLRTCGRASTDAVDAGGTVD